MAANETIRPIDPGVRIGHVHLKVAGLVRALQFYCGVLGFELTQRYGTQAAFVSAGGDHHHLGLNTWEISADRRRRQELRACTTRQFCTRLAARWRKPCGVFSKRTYRWTAPSIMASARRSTCVIQTTTAWNCIGTAHPSMAPHTAGRIIHVHAAA